MFDKNKLSLQKCDIRMSFDAHQHQKMLFHTVRYDKVQTYRHDTQVTIPWQNILLLATSNIIKFVGLFHMINKPPPNETSYNQHAQPLDNLVAFFNPRPTGGGYREPPPIFP